MSTPDGAGPQRPMRAAAMAMFGVAAIAAVIGLVSLATGSDDDEDNASQDRPAASSSTTGTPEPETSTSESPTEETSAVPPPTSLPTVVPAPPPAAPAPAPPPPAPSAADFVGQPIRVYNNSTISGLAQTAADDMTNAGWSVIEVGNYSQGVIPTSTVYYQPGQESAADTLAAEFGLRSEPRFDGLQSASPGIIVIITKDYNG